MSNHFSKYQLLKSKRKIVCPTHCKDATEISAGQNTYRSPTEENLLGPPELNGLSWDRDVTPQGVTKVFLRNSNDLIELVKCRITQCAGQIISFTQNKIRKINKSHLQDIKFPWHISKFSSSIFYRESRVSDFTRTMYNPAICTLSLCSAPQTLKRSCLMAKKFTTCLKEKAEKDRQACGCDYLFKHATVL